MNMESDAVWRRPEGKRVAYLADKLSVGGQASETDIRDIIDQLFDATAADGWSGQAIYESLSLLFSGGAGPASEGCIGWGIVDGEAFLERLAVRLQQDLSHHKKAAGGSTEVERAAVQLVSRLPDETLCKLLGNREATTALQGFVCEHPDAALRAFSIPRLASASASCWSFLDRRAFVNGAFEEGGDAQRFKQRVRDWIGDFFSVLAKLCNDPSDAVAAASFAAVGDVLREHPLCRTAVDEELRRFWGALGTEGETGESGDQGAAKSGFGGHKQAFPLQYLGEMVLRSTLPRIRRLLYRQSQMLSRPRAAAVTIQSCASIMVAALRLSTSPSGEQVNSPLLEDPSSIAFLGVKNLTRRGQNRTRSEEEEEEDVDEPLPPKDLAEEWIGVRLRIILEEGSGGDAVLVEAAAWATLRVLQTVAVRPMRPSTAPRVVEAFLRVLRAGQAAIPEHLWPSFHGGQNDVIAGAAIALRIASPSATSALAPHILAATERVSQPQQRLSLLADVFFLLLVRPARGGRPSRRSGGGDRGSGVGSRRSRGHNGTSVRPGEGARLLVSILEDDWFMQLVSDSPGRPRRLLFREETVAALATACTQVLAAAAVALSSPKSQRAAALGIGALSRSCHSAANSEVTGSLGNEVEGDEVAAAAVAATAAAKKGRWLDLETWLDCSLSTLEACTRCVNWTSTIGYVGSLAYVRLFSFILRLLCPVKEENDASCRGVDIGDRLFGGCFGGITAGKALDGDDGGRRKGGGGGGRLKWARDRLAQVVDDLMWRLREGLPGRDIRLRLLQATCTHVRLLAVVGGNERIAEDAANELASVLQGELGELDAEAGQGTQPLRGPAVTAGGESGADSSSRAQGRGESNTSGAAGVGAGPDSGGYHPGAATASMAAATTAMGGAPHAAGVEEEMMTMMPSTENGVYAMAAATTAVHRGSMTDVMAHELVVGCLVRLAMVSEGEIAMEVMSVLDDERGRARAREKLGLGAVGPMEEIVAKSIRAVDLLVTGRAPTPADRFAGPRMLLLDRLRGMMDLGWQAPVQADARALTGNAAEIFDHESHSLPALHRRLRRHLRGDIGTDDLANGPHLTVAGRNHEHVSAPTTAVNTAVFEAHAWEEEAPHSQLNGGSDPLVVTATHIVHRGHGSDRAGRGGVTLRITVYNATNARLHGFSIRFSFGQGGRAAGMGGGGRVEMSIDEVLMPSAAHTLEVPVTPLGGLTDVMVYVTVVFPDTEPEPDFESEGIAELLGIESGPASKGDIGDGRGNGMESFVPVTLHAGSYRLPAEAFLHPSQQVPITWAGFQNVWSGLPFTHAFPVETTCQRRTGASTVAVKGTNVSDSARTVRRAMLAKDGSFGGRTSSLAAATVACPIGASDYAMSIAWAFEAWDGTPVLCSLTAMKAPFSFAQPSRGHANGAAHQVGEEQASWFGRMEVRCGSCACADFAQSSSARLARFVTNRVFETSSPAGDVSQQTDPTTHDASFSKMFMPSSLPLGRSGVNDAHPDWFSRTDTSMPLIPRGSEGQHSPVGPSLPKKFSGRGATNVAKMSPLDRAVKDKAPVDTMSAISSAW